MHAEREVNQCKSAAGLLFMEPKHVISFTSSSCDLRPRTDMRGLFGFFLFDRPSLFTSAIEKAAGRGLMIASMIIPLQTNIFSKITHFFRSWRCLLHWFLKRWRQRQTSHDSIGPKNQFFCNLSYGSLKSTTVRKCWLLTWRVRRKLLIRFLIPKTPIDYLLFDFCFFVSLQDFWVSWDYFLA